MSASPTSPSPPAPKDTPKGIGSFLRRVLFSIRLWIALILLVIIVLVLYSALSNIYTPFTNDAFVQAYVVQVAPRVEGEVIRVHVQENQKVAKGDLLFEIDPRPFDHKIAHLEAKLVFTINLVAQMDSELDEMKAEEARIVAEEAYAEAVFEQEDAIFKQESTTQRKYLDAVQKFKVAKAGREKTQASVRKAHQALNARVGEEHALVAEVQAQLAEARLLREWTRVYAPANGLITNVQLRVGSYIPVGRPVLTCIDSDQWWLVSNFRENCLEHVRPGQRVGLTFRGYPGRVFSGKVKSVGWGVGEGQSVPSGELPVVKNPAEWIRLSQRFQVWVEPELPEDHPLRVGMTATATVYTREESVLNPLAEFWQEFIAWFGYLS